MLLLAVYIVGRIKKSLRIIEGWETEQTLLYFIWHIYQNLEKVNVNFVKIFVSLHNVAASHSV